MSQVVPQFMAFQDRLLGLIRDANGVDLGRPRVQPPGNGLIKLTLGEGIALMTAHERRHLWQARMLMAAPTFPKWCSLSSPVRRRSDRILFQIEHGACDQFAFVAGEVERGQRNVARRKQPPPGTGLDRLFQPVFSAAFFYSLDVMLIGR